MTQRLKRVAIFGEGILAKSPVVTRQRRLNCYLESRKDGDKATIVLYGTPGMALAFNASNPSNQPARGILGTPTALYEVCGSLFLSLSSTGLILFTGTLGTGAGSVSLSINPTQVMVVDGAQGYVYTPGASTFVVVGGSFPNGARTITQVNGFFLCEQPGSTVVWVSNLNDGTTWNGLSFFNANQYPDTVLAVDSLGGLVVVFSTGHLEFYQNVGATTEPFQYITNSALEYGLAAVFARAHVNNSIVFLCQTREGGIQVAQIAGFQVKIISTTDIDYILQQTASTATVSDATMLVYQQDTHKFVQITLPSANGNLGRSLLYDATMDTWSETQTGVTPAAGARHIGQFSCVAYGKTYVTDYSGGNIYQPSALTYQDNGNVILRELVTKTAVEEFNVFRCSALYFDMQTGVGLSNPALQGYAPLVTVERAVDGQDFGPVRFVSLGAQGQFKTRVMTRRWGRGRSMTFRLRLTDPVPFVVTAAAASVRLLSRSG